MMALQLALPLAGSTLVLTAAAWRSDLVVLLLEEQEAAAGGGQQGPQALLLGGPQDLPESTAGLLLLPFGLSAGLLLLYFGLPQVQLLLLGATAAAATAGLAFSLHPAARAVLRGGRRPVQLRCPPLPVHRTFAPLRRIRCQPS